MIEIEKLAHALVVCTGLKDVCCAPPFNLPLFEANLSMWAIIQIFQARLSPDLFLVALTICWKAWDIRNKEAHDSLVAIPGDVVHWSDTFLSNYKAASSSTLPLSIEISRLEAS